MATIGAEVEICNVDAESDWSIVPASCEVLRAEVALERGATTMEARALQAVLSVVAPPVDCGTRAPLRLVAVLDKSGSMQGEKLRLVRQTMLFMLRHLSERDALGIVEYDTHVKVAAPLTYCNADGRARLQAALERLQPGSQTNLSGGLLKGLELHRGGARQASKARAPAPLQRLRFGNTYRRLSDEEAQEREHYGHPGATPPEGAPRVHEWTMQLRFDAPEDEALVQKVVFDLHPTFRERVVEVLEAPFQLTRHGYGTFVVSATLYLHDGRMVKLQHELSFGQPETFQTLLLSLRCPPAGLDYFVNGVKKLRVTSLDLEHGVTSQRDPNVEGRTLHMDGVSYGSWPSMRRTTVPTDQLSAAARIVALFEGRGAEDKVEFTDTDGDSIVFRDPEGRDSEGAAVSPDEEKGVVRSTFLFTDGLANVGVTKPEELCAVAQASLGELGDRRSSFSTFGFGKDHNADLLQRLAELGEGIYSYVEDQDKIGEAFGEALGGLLSTTHQNVCLSLELAPGVGFSRAFTSYPVEGPVAGDVAGARTVRVDIGDLFAEERRDILLSLILPDAVAEGPQVLGQLRSRGFSVLACRTETVDPVSLIVQRRSDADLEVPCHMQVERHRNRHLATEALEAGRAVAQGGDLVGARRLLMAALEGISASPLTVQGDAVCVGLLTDLNECLADLVHEQRYREYGSKKMNCMMGAHMKQRACYGQDFSEQYANVPMRSMKAAFKANCS